MNTQLLSIIPVLPSANIARDIEWYREKVGFDDYYSDSRYAVLYRDELCLHLQWHAGTEADPLVGGSVIRIYVRNISAMFTELVGRGATGPGAFKTNTPWHTNEFGFYDLNNNAIFIMEDVA